MNVELEVTKPVGDRLPLLRKIAFVHRDCGSGAMQSSRNPVTDCYTLTCDCGLAVSFPQMGAASEEIVYAVIDEDIPRDLPADSFRSDVATSVRVVPRSAS